MAPTNGSNPLDDPEVKALLDEGGTLTSEHDFGKWQKSFLDKFTAFLDSSSSEKAQGAYNKFTKSSDGLIKLVKQLQKLIDQGSLSAEKTTVKARNAMSELRATLVTLIDELGKLMPTTASEAKRFGFTKYHMGAILVKDGFKYVRCVRRAVFEHLPLFGTRSIDIPTKPRV